MSRLTTTGVLGLLMLTSTACTYDFEKFRPTRSDLDYTKSWDAQPSADMKSDMPSRPDMPGDMDMPKDTPADMKMDMSKDMPKDTSDMMDVSQDMPQDAMDMPADQMVCGNGTVDPGETCDGDCPTSCDDNNACTVDTLTGDASMCTAMCSTQEITSCGPDDGCCPAQCTEAQDPDCAVNCKMPNTWPDAWSMLENEILPIVNLRRTSGTMCGTTAMPAVPPLVLDPNLVTAARCHAHDMATNNWIGPVSPPPTSTTIADRVNELGYLWDKLAVNVADADNAQEAVDGWFNSNTLCTYLMRAEYNETGMGYSFDANASGDGHRWSLVLSKGL